MTVSPAAELRAAAALLREIAGAATPGPWEGVVDDHGGGEINASVWADSIGYYITEKISSGPLHLADAHWIGLMSPVVAEPIAAWLDYEAGCLDEWMHVGRPYGSASYRDTDGRAQAIAFARAVTKAAA